MHKEIIGNATLYLGDALEIVPTLDPVDAVIIDGPYEKELHENFGGLKRLRNDGQGTDTRDLGFECINPIRDEVCRMTKDICQGWFLSFCTSEGVAAWRDSIEAAEMRYKRACVWVKVNGAPQLNGQGPALGHEMFVSAWCGKGHSKWNGGGKRGVFTHPVNNPDRDGGHPTEKALSLMEELIYLFTNPNDTVLDFFAGSGTTGIAAIKHGRKFIGVEKNPKYFDIMCRRFQSQPGSGYKTDVAPVLELTAP